jgi:hypothetical protein
VDSIEEAAQRLAETFGWHYGTLTDGTIVLEPPTGYEA